MLNHHWVWIISQNNYLTAVNFIHVIPYHRKNDNISIYPIKYAFQRNSNYLIRWSKVSFLTNEHFRHHQCLYKRIFVRPVNDGFFFHPLSDIETKISVCCQTLVKSLQHVAIMIVNFFKYCNTVHKSNGQKAIVQYQKRILKFLENCLNKERGRKKIKGS